VSVETVIRVASLRCGIVLAYLDHAATGPLNAAAAAAMAPWLSGRFGNPSGSHQVARTARAAVDDARDRMAGFVGVEPGGIIFTSGGTEADNLAVLGAAGIRPGPLVISAVEHPAVMQAAQASGLEVRLIPVDREGLLDLEGLRRLLDPDVALVSVQLANNETGVIQPLDQIARRVRKLAPSALFHTDAVQAGAWMDLTEATAAADLISLSAHKLGGPQGVGVLATRGRPTLRPVLHGGGQERELRSGTHNVAGIVGFAAAAEAARAAREENSTRVRSMRDGLAARIRGEVPGSVETASHARRLPGHIHLRFEGIESESLLVLLDEAGVCASAGSACASGAIEPSPILMAMGVAKDDALSSLRLTLGASTTQEEVDWAAQVVPASVLTLRGR
jgi:cysteine desulfurase